MTETANYGLKLMERADSGNWITGGLNDNTAKIDEVMKQLSDQLTDANGLITGLQNQLDTTNGSMTAQGGQITELGNLINGANGNIATLTQAVEDLQTKQPTGNVYEFGNIDDNKTFKIKFVRIGRLVMGTFLYGYNDSSTGLSDTVPRFYINNVPKDFLPFLSSSILPTELLGENNKFTENSLEYMSLIPLGSFADMSIAHTDDFFTDDSFGKNVSEIQNYIRDTGRLTINFHNAKIAAINEDSTHRKARLTRMLADNTAQIVYSCHWWDFWYMAN